ncbi:hypothetical protein FPOA_09567 [Fusarium poae]|uniref:Uncharacterized protein n=1 Tax=Fusarium poae TaxID=36050 RepID=A0A1B8ABI3_FUSPO|nr:hypothetical protein FPOA_09567 [Fusarium poae]
MTPTTFFRDPTKVNPHDEVARRLFLVAYMKASGHYKKELLEQWHKKAVMDLSRNLHSKGVRRVGHLAFEYMVDSLVWDDFLDSEGIRGVAPEFPWNNPPDENDYSQGISTAFMDWCLENGQEVPRDVPVSVSTNSTPQQVSQNKSSSQEGVDNDKLMEQPHIPSLAVRQIIWESVNGNLSFIYPVVGPFEIEVPSSLDFHGLIWGDDGKLYDQMISSLHDFLTIGWTIAGGRPSSLVVGFKPSHEDAARCHRQWLDLTTLWEDVITWVMAVRRGSSATLSDTLTIQHCARMGVVYSKSHGRPTGLHSESGPAEEE